MDKLPQSQIETLLKAMPTWSQVGEAIQRTYHFKDFLHAMKFVDQIAVAAERAQHHPDILIRYQKVTLTFATHDAGGITQKDFDGARQADVLSVPLELPPVKPARAPRPVTPKSASARGTPKAG
jgi:4a-hydroxytetrahydrobiopterin dehydratase